MVNHLLGSCSIWLEGCRYYWRLKGYVVWNIHLKVQYVGILVINKGFDIMKTIYERDIYSSEHASKLAPSPPGPEHSVRTASCMAH